MGDPAAERIKVLRFGPCQYTEYGTRH